MGLEDIVVPVTHHSQVDISISLSSAYIARLKHPKATAEAAEIAEENVLWIVTLWVSGARNSNDF